MLGLFHHWIARVGALAWAYLSHGMQNQPRDKARPSTLPLWPYDSWVG